MSPQGRVADALDRRVGSRSRPRARGQVRAGLVYGPAAAVAAAHGDRLVWALHRAALVRGLVPVMPAAAVAEAERSVTGDDTLVLLLDGVEVELLDTDRARTVGAVAAGAGADNLVTAGVIEAACRRNLAVVSERAPRMAELATELDHELVLHGI